ncbi:MAG TPA: hypothetical protein VFJ27_07950 [Terriglobia bacterium]|nr:hypothetical protein [Terriglobia bacterium]
MAKIVWTVQPLTDGYQGFVKVDSAILDEPNRAWFSVSEEPFASEVAAQMAVQDAIYRLGVKLAAKIPETLPSDIIIEKA